MKREFHISMHFKMFLPHRKYWISVTESSQLILFTLRIIRDVLSTLCVCKM